MFVFYWAKLPLLGAGGRTGGMRGKSTFDFDADGRTGGIRGKSTFEIGSGGRTG
ncbi:hypothetical protein [Paenibacillus jilunlii]|uniref:hypothetical protein n=1 Tax=Paenibacillus jilunlii TaxID=682956 RepID=UPI0013D43B45|nr:hypothetical protein [Paenibacillus jilunlii]